MPRAGVITVLIASLTVLAGCTGINIGSQSNDYTPVEGTIANLSFWVDANYTHAYFTLTGDPTRVYNAEPASTTPELRFIKPGAHVRLTYSESNGARVVQAYDDLDLQIQGA